MILNVIEETFLFFFFDINLLNDLNEKEIVYILNKRRVYQSRAYKRFYKNKSRYHRYRYDLSSLNFDFEKKYKSKVSFLYDEDNKFFLKLYKRYRLIDIKYFK